MAHPRCHNLLSCRILITRMALVILLLILAGCQGVPPRIIGFDPPDPSVAVGGAIEIQVNYALNGHRIDKFEWRAGEGKILGNGKPLITYRAPGTPGSYNISVELQYSGGTVEDSIVIQVLSAAASSTSTPTPTSTNTPTPIPTNTPTRVILSIDKIEVLMDNSPMDLDNLPRLTSGKMVVLEIFAVDSKGKRYASDDLVCEWSVTPIGANDQDITTDLCETFYTPSREYPVQTVAVEVQGLEQQFESIYPILLKFDITP
jgi:hypothetical protein